MGKGGDAKAAVGNTASASEVSTTTSKTSTNKTTTARRPKWVAPCSLWTEEEWKNKKFPTKSELRAVIPEHCFQRSAIKGFAYIVRDILMCSIVIYITYKSGLSSTEIPTNPIKAIGWGLAWFIYAWSAALTGGGLWVIGHECGHGAFSDYPLLNDIVGFIIHTFFLVPYFSWQYSHAKHHRRTNDMIEGETHVPDTFAERFTSLHYKFFEVLGEKGFAAYNLWFHSLLLYFLYFLGINSTAKISVKDQAPLKENQFPDHYRLNSDLYTDKMKTKVLLSNIGLLAWMGILCMLGMKYGFLSVFLWFEAPNLLVNNTLLVYITWMQHTHVSVPHFGADEWTWVKGALCGTIDRPYPWILDTLSHKIGSTHVCHHLFHEIPFYNAGEATAALKAYLEPMGLYNFDPTRLDKAAYYNARKCHFVQSIEGIQYYKPFSSVKTKSNNKNKEVAADHKKEK